MRTIVIAALAVTIALGATFLGVSPAHADGHERIAEIWSCKLNEGKTIEEVKALNSDWVKLNNQDVEGEIRSYVLTSLVGGSESFHFVDSFPSLEAWAATKERMDSTEEGQALDAEFEKLAKCSKNSLHRSERSQ